MSATVLRSPTTTRGLSFALPCVTALPPTEHSAELITNTLFTSVHTQRTNTYRIDASAKEMLAKADALLPGGGETVDAALLDLCPNCKVVTANAVGYASPLPSVLFPLLLACFDLT